MLGLIIRLWGGVGYSVPGSLKNSWGRELFESGFFFNLAKNQNWKWVLKLLEILLDTRVNLLRVELGFNRINRQKITWLRRRNIGIVPDHLSIGNLEQSPWPQQWMWPSLYLQLNQPSSLCQQPQGEPNTTGYEIQAASTTTTSVC